MRKGVLCAFICSCLLAFTGMYGECAPVQPTPQIEIEFEDDALKTVSGDPKISISLDPGTFRGKRADWWLVWIDPEMVGHYYSVEDLCWKRGIEAFYQGDLVALNLVVPSPSQLSEGTHFFIFAVDLKSNNNLDFGFMQMDFAYMMVVQGGDLRYQIQGKGSRTYVFPEEDPYGGGYLPEKNAFWLSKPVSVDEDEIFLFGCNQKLFCDIRLNDPIALGRGSDPGKGTLTWFRDLETGNAISGELHFTYCEILGRNVDTLNPNALRVEGNFRGIMETMDLSLGLKARPVSREFSGEFDFPILVNPLVDRRSVEYLEGNCVGGLHYGLE